jgi:hypothetical protein
MADFKMTTQAVGDDIGGMMITISYTGPGKAPAGYKVMYAVGGQNKQFGGLFTSDLATQAKDWSVWLGQKNLLNLELQLTSLPGYIIPRYGVTTGVPPTVRLDWHRYETISLSEDGSTATATVAGDPSAGIAITIMGTGGGGPDA